MATEKTTKRKTATKSDKSSCLLLTSIASINYAYKRGEIYHDTPENVARLIALGMAQAVKD